MFEATLFPELQAPARPEKGPRREPGAAPRPPTSHVVERLVYEEGRRVLTTTAGLHPHEIADLARAARFGPIVVRFRIPTPDRRLAEILEPHAPAPWARLKSLRQARRAGLVAGVVVAPLVPGVNAHAGDLRRLFFDARRAGAAFVAAEVELPGERRRAALAAELRRRYPRVAARHEVWRRSWDGDADAERARIERLLDELRVRFELPRAWNGSLGPPLAGRQRRFAFAV